MWCSRVPRRDLFQLDTTKLQLTPDIALKESQLQNSNCLGA